MYVPIFPVLDARGGRTLRTDGGSCKVDGTAHYAEDYATQRIYVTCGVWHGIYVTCGVWHGRSRCKIMSERRYENNSGDRLSRKIRLSFKITMYSTYFNRFVGHRIFTTDVFMIHVLWTPRSIR